MGIVSRILGGRRNVKAETWQRQAIQKIAAEMVRQIPPDWDRAALVLEPTGKGFGQGMHHSPITPDPAPSTDKGFMLKDTQVVLPDSELMAAAREFELGWVERKATFKRAIITVKQDADGWEIKSDYEHEN